MLGATGEQVLALGWAMGLLPPGEPSADQQRRSYLTVIRRNWHLLPYDQLLQLLGWSAAKLAYILREDDFLYIKLGSLKPKCLPLKYAPPEESVQTRAGHIANLVKMELAGGLGSPADPLFGFVAELSSYSGPATVPEPVQGRSPRFCYSYFALYGDPLLDTEIDPYPDGYLKRLAALGVTGVWLQAVLSKLAPFPWMEENESEREVRLRNLQALVQRAARLGIGVYLYLNEPRAMPRQFFERRPDLKGVSEGEYSALCTSQGEVRRALTSAIAHVCKAVPDLAGFFTITASENLSSCWSHGQGSQCPRCARRKPAEVIAEVIETFYAGIREAGTRTDLIAWDWGWADDWAPEIIQRLPAGVALQSVSEWSIPIQRGGVASVVGEYSISTIGPGPRATRHWKLAKQRGLRRIAKIQAGNTWELSATPYIPALENVARHAARLKEQGVDGLMLGWTLGGYPSPNLEVACAVAQSKDELSQDERVNRALQVVAQGRFGKELAGPVVQAWKTFSRAFSEFPFDGGLVYNAPMQFGPSNLLWSEPTGYHATMIGFPYDDLDGWRQVYPPEVFVRQFMKIADGFEEAIALLRKTAEGLPRDAAQEASFRRELDVATAAAIHFRSTGNQARFVELRKRVREGKVTEDLRVELRRVLESEIALARQLLEIQQRDSRIGFEASNQYYYVPQDLAEKVINCRYLLDQWLPTV